MSDGPGVVPGPSLVLLGGTPGQSFRYTYG